MQASRESGISQATLSRHLAALEDDLQVVLFDRTGKGLTLLSAGEVLYEQACKLEEAAHRFSSVADDLSQNDAGVVRVSASELVSYFDLPAVLKRLREQHSSIHIELVAADTTSNLLSREADIAIRMYRPEHMDLIAKKIGEYEVGAYASTDYIAAYGLPESIEDLKKFDLIGEDKSRELLIELNKLGMDITRDAFRYKCDNRLVAWNLMCSGCGIGFFAIRPESLPVDVQQIGDVTVTLPVWLTCNVEMKTSKRIRLVFEFLSDELSGLYGS